MLTYEIAVLVLVLMIFIEVAYLSFKSIFHKVHIYVSSTVQWCSTPFLEPTSTKQ